MGKVNRTTLQSYYQAPGETYDDAKTEGALNTLADQVDANDTEFQAVKSSLASTASGSSGADYVKATELNAQSGSNVQAILAYLLAQIQGVTQGAVADGSVGTAKLSDGAVTLAKMSAADVVAIATANKLLKLDANAKLPASITGDAATVAGFVPARSISGSYTGDSINNRLINIGFTPKLVVISSTLGSAQSHFSLSANTNAAGRLQAASAADSANTAFGGEYARDSAAECTTNGFYVSYNSNGYGTNASGAAYNYIAIG